MYSADDIEVLKAPQAIRRRTAMYVGDVNDRLLPNRLLQESLCVALDEGRDGPCQNVRVRIAHDGEAEVDDDGPGWSLELDRSGRPRAEVFMTQLFACRHAKENERSRRVCQMGVAVLNALSEWAELTIWRDGFEWRQDYARGEVRAPFQRGESTWKHGTRLKFKLDPEILPCREFSMPELVAWLRENASLVNVVVSDGRSGEQMSLAAR